MVAKVVTTVLVFVLFTSCVTWMSSEPAADGVKGIRYSLPQPFLLVTPKADGTIDVETVMLPDASHTYVIRQRSFIAKHTLDVELDNGLLKTVSLNADTTAVAAEVAKGLGEVKKATIEAEIAQTKAATDAAKAARQKIIDAQAAVHKAQVVLDYLEDYVANNQSDDAAKAKLVDAGIALRQAEADLVAAEDAARQLGLEGFNVAGAPAGGPEAYGPVLYRVVQTDSAVNLVAVDFETGNTQKKFPTSTSGLPAAEQPPTFALDPAEKIVLANAPAIFHAATTVAVKSYDDSKSIFARVAADGSATPVTPKPTVAIQSGGRVLEIGVQALTTGTYKFSMALAFGDDPNDTESHDLKIKVP